jgi:hypothetical protein
LIPLSEPFSRKGYCKLLKILVCDEIVDDSVPLSKYIAFMLSQKKKCKKKNTSSLIGIHGEDFG